MAQNWTRIEGMIIGHDLDPSVDRTEQHTSELQSHNLIS